MKSRLLRALVFLVASNIVSNASAGPIDIFTQADASIFGKNSDGTFVPLTAISELDLDTLRSDSTAGPISAATDLGFATARAGVGANHPQEPGKSKLAGLGVGGSGNLSIPASLTGEITVSTRANVEYNDSLTWDNGTNDPLRIEGFVRLGGRMDVAITPGPLLLTTRARVVANISGTGIGFAQTFVEQRGDQPKFGSGLVFEPINQFSYQVTSRVPKDVQLNIALLGILELGTKTANHSTMTFSGAAAFVADFQNSLHWGGITRVTNLRTGELVTDWTVTSASGFDYSQVFPEIPEPSSLVLLLSGVVGVALRRSPL